MISSRFTPAFNRSALSAACALALVLAAGSTLAADDQPAKTPASSGDAPLKGPAVKDSGVPGDHRKLADGESFDRKDRDRPLPQRVFMRAIGELRGDEAPDALRLSADQQEKIKAANESFMHDMQTYREAHRDEAQALMKDLAPGDRRRAAEMLGGGPGKGGPDGKHAKPGDAKHDDAMNNDGQKPDPAKAEAAREKLKALFDAAPKPDDARAQIYAVLSAPQKEFVQKQIEKFRAEGDKMRGEKRAEEIKKKMGDGDGKNAARREEMREKLKAMSPEERRQAIEDMRAKRDAKNLNKGKTPAPAPADPNNPEKDNGGG